MVITRGSSVYSINQSRSASSFYGRESTHVRRVHCSYCFTKNYFYSLLVTINYYWCIIHEKIHVKIKIFIEFNSMFIVLNPKCYKIIMSIFYKSKFSFYRYIERLNLT